MSEYSQVIAKNVDAPFTLKLHRSDGIMLLAMNWKTSEPPRIRNSCQDTYFRVKRYTVLHTLHQNPWLA